MARYVTVDNVAARWPSDGRGGRTATDSSSETASASTVEISHFLVQAQHTSATTVTIMEHDGTTSRYVINIPATTTEISTSP